MLPARWIQRGLSFQKVTFIVTPGPSQSSSESTGGPPRVSDYFLVTFFH